MTHQGEYRLQTILAAIQCGLIIVGIVYIRLLVRWLRPELPLPSELPWLPAFTIHWGLLILLIPLAWIITTVRLERRHSRRWSWPHTLASGMAMLFLLCGFFTLTASATYKNLALHGPVQATP